MTRLYRGPYSIARRRPLCPDCELVPRLRGEWWWCPGCGQRVGRWLLNAQVVREALGEHLGAVVVREPVPPPRTLFRRDKTTGTIPGQGALFAAPEESRSARGAGSHDYTDAEVVARRPGPLAPREQDDAAPTSSRGHRR